MRRISVALLSCVLFMPFAGGCDDGDSGTTGDGDGDSSSSSGSSESGTDGDTTGETTGETTGDTTGETTGDTTGDTTDTGAGDTGGGAHAGSCDFRPGELMCWHAINEWDEPATIQQACTDGGGTYSAGDCATEGLVAICDQTPWKIFHYYEGIDLELGEFSCGQIGGTWMPQ